MTIRITESDRVLRSRIDHIAITAPSLASGVESVRQVLEVTPRFGGEHPRMATHNALLRLGEAVYLEVIAANPDAPPAGRPRWFELDRLAADASPRLATWVARTEDIRAAAGASGLALGAIEAMSRGPLNWLITIPSDGSLPEHGIAPVLIQWLNDPHPASRLPDLGCSLVRLEGFHPEPSRIGALLEVLGFEGAFSLRRCAAGEPPHLVAHIRTPHGLRRLGVP